MNSTPETPTYETPEALVSSKLHFVLNELREIRIIISRHQKNSLVKSLDTILEDLHWLKRQLAPGVKQGK